MKIPMIVKILAATGTALVPMTHGKAVMAQEGTPLHSPGGAPTEQANQAASTQAERFFQTTGDALRLTTNSHEASSVRGATFKDAVGAGGESRQTGQHQEVKKPKKISNPEIMIPLNADSKSPSQPTSCTVSMLEMPQGTNPAMCPIGLMAVTNQVTEVNPGVFNRFQGNQYHSDLERYTMAAMSGHILPEIEKAMLEMKDWLEYDVEKYVAKQYGVPTWAATLVRYMFDLHMDDAFDKLDPMAHIFGSAALPLQNFLNYVSLMNYDDWYKIRMEGYYEEFADFRTYTRKEAAMMTFLYKAVEPEVLQAAQFLLRDVTRQAAWNAVANYTEKTELTEDKECNAYWACSASDAARRAALEIIAMAYGYTDLDQSMLRFYQTSFEELDMNYFTEMSKAA